MSFEAAEKIADATGLPVGLKSAVGDMTFWKDLGRLMATTGRGVDFITIDGGEGGTGAAPLVFTDHVALPFKIGFSRVYRELVQQGVRDQVVFIGSGKLGFPDVALLAMALGCDMVNVAREAMLSIGCIQAQRCHTGHCPTGVATQNLSLQSGLVVEDKAPRIARFHEKTLKALAEITRAAGLEHPGDFRSHHLHQHLMGMTSSGTDMAYPELEPGVLLRNPESTPYAGYWKAAQAGSFRGAA